MLDFWDCTYRVPRLRLRKAIWLKQEEINHMQWFEKSKKHRLELGVSENSCQTGKVNAARKCHLFQHQGAMRQPSSLRAGSRALWYKWDNGGNGECTSCQLLHFSICATCVTGKSTRPPYDICVHLSKIIPSKLLYQHGLLQTANERNFAVIVATRLPSGGF